MIKQKTKDFRSLANLRGLKRKATQGWQARSGWIA
jgi:hypothetical protein